MLLNALEKMGKENDELRASNFQLKLSLNDLKISMSDLKKKKKNQKALSPIVAKLRFLKITKVSS